ncbi:MAG: segregation/condensation protein A [Gammaproteobacteria bacterium]|nr:segregation/condensation protein A [Gammaproteobacteria bacterium]
MSTHDAPTTLAAGERQRPQQAEMPFAIVQGMALTEPPKDLYIPPDALEVFLEAFAGPLDLLLYLIKRQNLDILDIPIARITEQYMAYIELMQGTKLELAAEYLVMAAMLAEIKSRMLLPRPAQLTQEEADPRAELVRRLQEYERYKKAALDLDELPRIDRELHRVVLSFEQRETRQPPPEVPLETLLAAFREVLTRASMFADHRIARESLSVRERMALVLERARRDTFLSFSALFSAHEGRAGAVVTLLAVLELLRQSLIELVQNDERAPLYLKLAA